MAKTERRYRLGMIYAVVTIVLLSAQNPLSLPAAQRMSVVNFVLATQVILLCSLPLLLRTAEARRDFVAIVTGAKNLKHMGVLLVIGLANHVLYFLALSNADPITIAAVLNLSPFWAALVAFLVARKAVPTNYAVFGGCLISAFIGAMLIAISQTKGATFSWSGVRGLSPYWLFAVPVPILFALSGTLIAKWFADYDEMACIAVTFVTASIVLIPLTAIISFLRADLHVFLDPSSGLFLLAVGTILGAAVGLVIYQMALSVTGNDNGFVTMFFLLGPGLTALMSMAMSPWLPQLKFSPTPVFFAGLAIVAMPIFFFSRQARRGQSEGEVVGRVPESATATAHSDPQSHVKGKR
jgi:drug/metabolite transporter (DMT)-like permease